MKLYLIFLLALAHSQFASAVEYEVDGQIEQTLYRPNGSALLEFGFTPSEGLGI